jgi:hypothetical protein
MLPDAASPTPIAIRTKGQIIKGESYNTYNT